MEYYQLLNVVKMNIMSNKNGAVLYLFVYALIFLGFIGVMYVIYNQIVTNYYTPVLEDTNLNFSDYDKEQAYKFQGIWKMLPLFFIILVFSFILYKIYLE